MIKYIIIDDEPLAHEVIEGFASELPNLVKVGNCYDAFEAIRLLQKVEVDLLFLDINMPKLSGFEMLKTIPNPPKVIVTSAYKEYAMDGYEFNVIDYLLKPFIFERFVKAVNKLTPAKIILGNIKKESSEAQQIFIKGDKKQHQIDLRDVLFIEASGNYCKVFLKDDVIVTLEKISEFENILSAPRFLRVHKSFIVSKSKIKIIEGNLIHLKGHKIPIGQTYKKAITNLYG
jgi:DNA-binding LytR/AlgR family response regulator